MAGVRSLPARVDRWFAESTFHHREFADLRRLVELKERQGLTISAVLPTLNEAATIGPIVRAARRELMENVPLLDELLVIDSDSSDDTRDIAAGGGRARGPAPDVLPRYGSYRGKGEALWKSLYETSGDLVAWSDTDISDWHPRFLYGTLGPLLVEPRIGYVKAYYQRPIVEGGVLKEGGGGRVTELVARPLINLFFPELSGYIQPLSGEYAGRREHLEQIPFFTGYAVEIGHLIDLVERLGLDGLGQVDLDVRIHRNQELEGLSRMSFVILQAVMKRLEERRRARALRRARLDHEAAPLEPQPALAGGHRAGRRGAPADDRASPSTARGVASMAEPGGPEGHRPAASRVLVAPDSFKGSLSSVVVARALADGWTAARPRDALRLAPMADGGEGTLDAVAANGGWAAAARRRQGPAHADARRQLPARRRPGRRRAGRGLRAVAAGGRRARRHGRQHLRHRPDPGRGHRPGLPAHRPGPRRQRHDRRRRGAARGPRRALPRRRRRGPRRQAAARSGTWPRIDLSDIPAILAEVSLTVASDVTNPLLGELGAAATYGPQKGADEEQVAGLDRNLRRYADVMEATVGRTLRDEPGTGAAGGTTFGLLAIADRFASFEVRPGVEVVMELTGFVDELARADLVLTGEGSVDAQTAFGKTAMGVAERARASGVPVICFGGGVTPEGAAVMAGLGAVSLPVIERPMSLDEVRAAGVAPIERAAERAARLLDLAGRLAP